MRGKDFEGGRSAGGIARASDESECGCFRQTVSVLCDGRERPEMEQDNVFYLSFHFTSKKARNIAFCSLHSLSAPVVCRGCKPGALLACAGAADRASKDSIEFKEDVHEQGW